jgi:P pilus assembly chaperone PapD
MSASIRIVLYVLHATGDTVLVSFEVDDSIVALVSATPVSRRNATVVITATRIRFRRKQRSMRLALMQIVTNGTDDESSAWRDRSGFS